MKIPPQIQKLLAAAVLACAVLAPGCAAQDPGPEESDGKADKAGSGEVIKCTSEVGDLELLLAGVVETSANTEGTKWHEARVTVAGAAFDTLVAVTQVSFGDSKGVNYNAALVSDEIDAAFGIQLIDAAGDFEGEVIDLGGEIPTVGVECTRAK